MRVSIVSRIFDPEPSAASIRLGSLAARLAERGHIAEVLTVRPPKKLEKNRSDDTKPYRVRRWPVLRDSSGYVRGYLQYLSFDIPVFFRILFSRNTDIYVVEPPPTTGFSAMVATAIRRKPYYYYAADIWSDGASQTGTARWIVLLVKFMEIRVMRGAQKVLSVSEILTTRLKQLGVEDNVLTVGNGVDSNPFTLEKLSEESFARSFPPQFIYAGTASEWHGASIFVEALPLVLERVPDAKIRFIGSGSEIETIRNLAAQLGVSQAVSIEPLMTPVNLAEVLRNATAALASIRPGLGNEFTFPTKLYASTFCGTHAIFAGVGPAIDFLQIEVGTIPLGVSVELTTNKVAEAMISVALQDDNQDLRLHRRRVANWALKNVSLSSVVDKIINDIESNS